MAKIKENNTRGKKWKPETKFKDYAFSIRTPKKDTTLRESLEKIAAEKKWSLNQLCVEALWKYIEQNKAA